MAILMWPPSDGSKNTISVNGRIYSALPGTSVVIGSIDVNILESNNWTTYQTLPGQTTIPIQTPVGVPTERFVVNGRVYIFQPGSTVYVNSFDYPILEANGFVSVVASASSGTIPVNTGLPIITGAPVVGQTLTAGNGTWANTPTSFTYQWLRSGVNIAGATGNTIILLGADIGNPITVAVTAINGSGSSASATSTATSIVQPAIMPVPAGAIGVFSVVKTSIGGTPWAGNCLQVKRASDRTTLDIGWNGNVVDWAAADAFAAGSALEASIWYDQSGVGNNFVNPTNDRAPMFVRESHWKGIRGLTNDTIGTGASPRGLSVTWAVAPDQNTLTIYHVGAPRTSFEPSMYWDAETAAFAGSRQNLVDLQQATGMHYNRNGSNGSTNKGTISQLNAVALSPLVADINGAQVTLTTPASLSVPCMQLFTTVAGGGVTYSYKGDKFFFAVYPAAHDASTVATNRATFLNAFAPNTQTKELLVGGNSMNVGSRDNNGNTLAWRCGFGRTSEDDAGSPLTFPALPTWRVRNIGASGRTLAQEFTDWETGNPGNNLIDPGMSRIIYYVGSATNDINNTTFASTAAAQATMDTLFANLLTHIASVRAAGVNGVVVNTMIPITGAALGSGNFREDARVYINNKIRTGATANGYVVSDWCSVAPFDTQTGFTNTTFYYTDGVHPNAAGYALLAPLDRAAILAA